MSLAFSLFLAHSFDCEKRNKARFFMKKRKRHKFWSHLGKRCQRPDIPQNGRIFGNKFYIGSTVEFFCNSGFTLYGSRKRTCLSDKTWNGTVAICDDGSKLEIKAGCGRGVDLLSKATLLVHLSTKLANVRVSHMIRG